MTKKTNISEKQLAAYHQATSQTPTGDKSYRYVNGKMQEYVPAANGKKAYWKTVKNAK